MAAGELLRFEHGELDGVEGSGHASDIAIHNQRGAAAQAIALAIGSVGEVPGNPQMVVRFLLTLSTATSYKPY